MWLELSVTQWLVAAVVGLAGLLYIFRPKPPKNFPPGPRGIPIIGVVPFIGFRPDKKFQKWAKQYGDVMGVTMGNHLVVVLSNIDVINEALAKNGEVYSGRPHNYLHDVVWQRNGISSISFSEGWKDQRKFVVRSLRKLGFGKSSLEASIQDEARHLGDAFRKTGSYAGASECMMEAVGNLICVLCLGQRYEYEMDSGFLKFAHNLTTTFRKASRTIQVSVLLPWSATMPPLRSPMKALKHIFAVLVKSLEQSIDEHKETLDENHIRDFTDDYLVEMSKRTPENKGLFNEATLTCTLRDLFLGGMETIFSTLSWALIVLSNRPEIMKKLQAEIDEVIGRGRPSMRHKDDMPYTQAFLQEVLRYRTLLPFGVARTTSQDTVLQGYSIPKGTTVIPNYYAVHNDSRVWGDPENFRVERHLKDGKFLKSNYIVAFGVGLRSCIGKNMAEMEFFIMMTSFLQEFDIASGVEGWQFEDMRECGFTSTPPSGVKINFVERK